MDLILDIGYPVTDFDNISGLAHLDRVGVENGLGAREGRGITLGVITLKKIVSHLTYF